MEAFRVTGRDSNDLRIHPGLPSTVPASTPVGLARQLYYKPGAEGSSIALWWHQEQTLWVATGCRLSMIGARRSSAEDGRLIVKLRCDVGQWVPDHGNADPYYDLNPCNCASGEPATFNPFMPIISSEYCGIGGGVGAAPVSFPRLTTDPNPMTFALEVAFTTQVRRGHAVRSSVCKIRSSDADGTTTIDLCDRVDLLDNDPGNGASRAMIVCAGPLAQTSGVIFWLGGQELDAIPEDTPNGDVVEEPKWVWKLGEWHGDDVSGASSTYRAGVNRVFAIGLIE